MEQWKQLVHANDYYLWNESSMESFIRQKEPEFLKVYKSFPAWINRCDCFRYFALYYIGGWYVDMDAFPTEMCMHKIQELSTLEHIFVIKHIIMGIKFYTNCVFAAKPNSEIMKRLYNNASTKNANVMFSAGPWYMTRMIWAEYEPYATFYLNDLGVIHTSDKTWVNAQVNILLRNSKVLWLTLLLMLLCAFIPAVYIYCT
jgi:mannosyltransferase OCH1-like enzyme